MKIFTYGSLLRGLHNYWRFVDALTFIKEQVIEGPYVLFTYKGLTYPFLAIQQDYKFEDGQELSSTVKGEIFEVNKSGFEAIERMELGAGYRREEIMKLNGESVYVYLYGRVKPQVKIDFSSMRAIVCENNDWMAYIEKYDNDFYKRCMKECAYYLGEDYKTKLWKKSEIKQIKNLYCVRDSKGRFVKKTELKTISIYGYGHDGTFSLTLPENDMDKVKEIFKRNKISWENKSSLAFIKDN